MVIVGHGVGGKVIQSHFKTMALAVTSSAKAMSTGVGVIQAMAIGHG
jgi:hypothetical protein